MSTYIAFLRAINLGAKRKVPMADLRQCLAEAGYEDVETYIQTGNVRLRTATRGAARVEKELEELLADRFGFEIPTILFTPAALRTVHDDAQSFTAPHPDVKGERRYVILFKDGQAPIGEDAARLEAWAEPGEAGRVIGRAAHVWVDSASQAAKILPAFNRALAPGTNRTAKVLATVVDMWAS